MISWSTMVSGQGSPQTLPYPGANSSPLRAGLGGPLPKVEGRAWDGGASIPLGCVIPLVNRASDPSAWPTSLGHLNP